MLWKVEEDFHFPSAPFNRPERRLLVKRSWALVRNTDSFATGTLKVRHETIKLTMLLILEAKAIGDSVYLLRNQMSACYHHKADVLGIL